MIFQRNSSNAKTWHSMALRLSPLELFPLLFPPGFGRDRNLKQSMYMWGVLEMGKHL